MKPLEFHSCLAAQIQTFIRLRQLSGSHYHSGVQMLGYFDRFVVNEKIRHPRVTRDITEAYQRTLSHLTLRVQSNRFSVVRQFCRYLSRTDPLVYVPESLRTITPPSGSSTV